MSKLFVANLPNSINEDVLRQLFEAAGGSVVDVHVPRDNATGYPKGFAFITLAGDKDAEVTMNKLDGSFQGGRSIAVKAYEDPQPQRRTVVESISHRVVVPVLNVNQVAAMLRAANAGGIIHPGQWMGHNGFFWWSGPVGPAMRELAEAIGGEPLGEGEAFKDARARLLARADIAAPPPAPPSRPEMPTISEGKPVA